MAPVSLLVDGMLSGTGIRDAVNGGYVAPKDLGLTSDLTVSIARWLSQYEEAHYNGFPPNEVSELDLEGLEIATEVSAQLANHRVGYFSNGLMARLA